MADFYRHPDVKLALQIFDYGSHLVTFDIVTHGVAYTITATPAVVKLALDPHGKRVVASPTPAHLYTPTELALRDIFDGFLGRLERIENLIKNDVIAAQDFRDHFSYWLQLLAERPARKDTVVHLGNSRRRRLWAYIRYYEFNGVVRLFNRFARAAPVGTPAEMAFDQRPRRKPSEAAMSNAPDRFWREDSSGGSGY